MGVRMVVQVLDHAPADLTAGERLLLIALAEKADDATRRVLWSRDEDPRTTLRRRTGLSDSGLRKTFQRLADRGLDPRVVLLHDAAGRPVFAHHGAVATYRLPQLDEGGTTGSPSEDGRRDHGVTIPETKAGPQGHEGGTTGSPAERERRDHRVALVPLSLDSLDPRAPEAAAALLERWHGQIDHDTAGRAVAGMLEYAASKPFKIDDIVRFACSRRLDELPGYAKRAERRDQGTSGASRRGTPADPIEECGHGTRGGMLVLGHGPAASRLCTHCEVESPADGTADQSGLGVAAS